MMNVGEPPAPGPEPQPGRQIIVKMVAAWAEANRSVRTVDCRAAVEFFYPKGALSDRENQSRGPKSPNRIEAAIPAADTRMSGKCRWAMDFNGPNIRTEFRGKRALYKQDEPPEFADSSRIVIFADGKHRVFRPRAENAPMTDQDGNDVYRDAIFHEERAQNFILAFAELPLMWTGGSVTGKLLLPKRMKLLEQPVAWTYRGEGNHKTQTCHIVTLPNQESKTSVLEFWVGKDPDFPIYVCRAKEGNNLHWQIEAEYQRDRDRSVLTGWIYTEVDYFSQKVYLTQTYRIQQLQVNSELLQNEFDHTPKPGMVVYFAPESTLKQVRADGSLGPWEPSHGSRWTWPVVIVVGIILLGLSVYSWRRTRPAKG